MLVRWGGTTYMSCKSDLKLNDTMAPGRPRRHLYRAKGVRDGRERRANSDVADQIDQTQTTEKEG
jgi:hypothetical protein